MIFITILYQQLLVLLLSSPTHYCLQADSTHVNNFCNFGLYLSEELGKFEQAEEMYR